MFLVFLVVLGGALLLGMIFKEKLENTIPFFMLLIIFVLYLTALMFNLTVGFILLVSFGLVGLGITLYRLIKKQTRKDTFNSLWEAPLFVFAALCIFIYLINITRQFQLWDEFSHWGPMIREMVRLHDFYNQVGSALFVHRDYPPGITLFQYFYLRLEGGFSEQGTYRALQLLTLTLMLPAFSKVRSKLVVGCIFLIMLFLPDALGMSVYLSIYTDTILGVLLGYSIFMVIFRNGNLVFCLMNLFLVSLTIVLTKQMGLLLILIPILILFIEGCVELINRKKSEKKSKTFILVQIKSIGTMILGAIFGLLTWGLRLSSVNVSGGQFSIGDILSGTFDILRGNALPHQMVVADSYIRAIFMSGIIPFFNLSYLRIFFVLTVVTILLYLFSKRQGEGVKLLPLVIGTPLGVIMYAVAMLIVYMVGFCEFEGVRLASYDRYMGTVIVGFGVGIFLVFMKVFIKNKNNDIAKIGKFILFTGAFCTLMISGELYHRILISGIEPRPNFEQGFKREHHTLFNHVNLSEDRVYLIMQETDGFDFWRTRFYANPLETNGMATWSIGTTPSEGDIWTYLINAEEWSEKLLTGEFGYVYLYGINQQFKDEFDSLFYEPENIRERLLLRVTEKDGRVLLKEVEEENRSMQE